MESLTIIPLEEGLPAAFHKTYITALPSANTENTDSIVGQIEDILCVEEKEHFESTEIQKVLKHSSEKAILNLKDELMTQLKNKETDQQTRIKKLENKIKQIK